MSEKLHLLRERRDFQPGDLVWTKTTNLHQKVVPIHILPSDEMVSLESGIPLTIIRRALARDMPRLWQRNTLRPGLTFARFFATLSWLAVWENKLIVIQDKNLNMRTYKKGRKGRKEQ